LLSYNNSYGNLREVIRGSRYCEKFLFFDVFLLKRCGKGQIELARERLSGRSTGWEWSGGTGGAGRLTGASPHGPGRWEGQREEPGRDVRVGLRKPAGGVGRTRRRVEGLEVLSDW